MSHPILAMRIFIKNEIDDSCPVKTIFAMGHIPIMSDTFCTYTNVETEGMTTVPLRNVLQIDYGKYDKETKMFVPCMMANSI